MRIRGAPVRQKLGMILENKVVQKFKLETNVFYKKWSPKLIFLNEYMFLNSVDFWHKKFPLSMLILGETSCILGPTIFKIPQPN